MKVYSKKTSFTPSEILEIFKEQHRLCTPLDIEADSSIQLDKNSTIRDWRIANDLVGWRKLGDFINKEFKIEISKEQWKEILEPSEERRLWEVCKLISGRAIKIEAIPIKIFGEECITASMFKVLKRNLKEREVDVSQLKPSSYLKEYLSNNYEEVIMEITRYGVIVIEELVIRRKLDKRSFWDRINIFDSDSHEIIPIGVETFREIIEKVLNEKRIACA